MAGSKLAGSANDKIKQLTVRRVAGRELWKAKWPFGSDHDESLSIRENRKSEKRKPRFKLGRFHVLTRAATLNHTAAMLVSLAGRWMVSWVAVCVLLLFLFPLVQGPFQATHGPNTAFRARRALIILVLSIIRCGMSVFAMLSASARVLACGLAMLHLFNERLQSDPLDSMILRCWFHPSSQPPISFLEQSPQQRPCFACLHFVFEERTHA
jgi:hypothetical protein